VADLISDGFNLDVVREMARTLHESGVPWPYVVNPELSEIKPGVFFGFKGGTPEDEVLKITPPLDRTAVVFDKEHRERYGVPAWECARCRSSVGMA
jgi:hypothetical protein